MGRYYFDIIEKGAEFRDEDGIHASHIRDAEFHATLVLSEILPDTPHESDASSLQVAIREESGNRVALVTLTLKKERLV
jgi:hypothetical protein